MNATIRSIAFCLAATGPLARAQAPAPASPPADVIDHFIEGEMQRRQIPGLSLAIIQDGKVARARGFGTIERGKDAPVTATTFFQAGSISKPVAALGALRLVGRGELDLDEDVNRKLVAWKVPENEFTREKKVTLRGLLGHTAGLTVHGFPGYAADAPVPSLVQVLDGAKPANTPPIRVNIAPESIWRYSGGGYTVMQQLVLDVTGRPYPELMRETVLAPLGMEESTFEQPLPRELAGRAATGHVPGRGPIAGRWHTYPEMAAAGLWTTPTELARFAIGVQEALAGKPGGIVSREMAREMLTARKNDYGLGVFLEGSGRALRFGHGGRDEGFDAFLVAYAETGQGAVVMINTNDNSRMMGRIRDAIGRAYGWPDAGPEPAAGLPMAQVGDDELDACVGRYEYANNQMITFVRGREGLATLTDGLPDDEFVPEGGGRFHATGRSFRIDFRKDDQGRVSGVHWEEPGRQGDAPRIGPLFHGLEPAPDPDPSRTEKVMSVLHAFGRGGKAMADVEALAPGARADFSGVFIDLLAGAPSVTFLMEREVPEGALIRHEGKVARILHYRLEAEKGRRGLLIYVTPDGLITDYDIVRD